MCVRVRVHVCMCGCVRVFVCVCQLVRKVLPINFVIAIGI